MYEKFVFDLSSRQDFERKLEKRIGDAVGIIVSQQDRNNKRNSIELVIEKKGKKGLVTKNEQSSIYASENKKVVVYISDINNKNIIEELNYIHSNYCFSMGTVKNFINGHLDEDINSFFIITFCNEENIKEGKNYATSNSILAYDGAYENNDYFDLVVSEKATLDNIADVFETFFLTNTCFFEKVLFENQINKNTKECIFVVKNNYFLKQIGYSRKNVGTVFSDRVIELAYGNQIRIYIGTEKADYIMCAYGESILDSWRKIISINLPNNILVKIYQKDAPKFDNEDVVNYFMSTMK